MSDVSSRFFAVPEGTKCAGLQTFWTLTGTIDYDRLAAAWLAAGLDEALLPTPPTPRRALKRALKHEASKRRLVRPLAESAGYAIVNEDATDDTTSYEVRATAKLNPVGRPVIESSVFPADGLQAEVEHHYDEALAALSTADVSGWLCNLAEGLRAVSLRPTGGIYFVPAAHVEEWLRYREVVVGVSGSTIERVPMMAVESVFDAIMHAVQEDLGRVAETLERKLTEAQAGEIGPRAVATQVREAHEAEAKLAQYEELMGRNLVGLRERLDGLRAALVIAALADDSADAVGMDAVAAAGA